MVVVALCDVEHGRLVVDGQGDGDAGRAGAHDHLGVGVEAVAEGVRMSGELEIRRF